MRRTPDQATYEAGVERIREYIRAGDAFQVVLSQRAERPTSASALDLYRALRRVNPSPYLFLLELGGLALIGSSPETLVKCEDGRASLNPIAGTTHPGEGDAERLLDSAKDRAEHVMLVDLGRNDLSRVCREHITEVISSQHILLEDDHVLEVLLMQGPAATLRQIANELVTCKGVKSTHLSLTPHLMPPLHAKRAND